MLNLKNCISWQFFKKIRNKKFNETTNQNGLKKIGFKLIYLIRLRVKSE